MEEGVEDEVEAVRRHRGINEGYKKSVAVVVVAALDEDMVDGCLADMIVLEEVEETGEGEGAAGEFRRRSTVLMYRIRLVVLQLTNGPD